MKPKVLFSVIALALLILGAILYRRDGLIETGVRDSKLCEVNGGIEDYVMSQHASYQLVLCKDHTVQWYSLETK